MNSSTPFKCVVAIVVTYNGSNWITKCIGSLAGSNYPVEIIVVDNCSSDNTIPLVEHNFSDVLIVRQEANLGFGKANNVGISLALQRGADYVFLLNQDAWIQTDTIDILIRAHQHNPQYGVLSPVHYSASGDKLDHGFRSYLLRHLTADDVRYIENRSLKAVLEVPFANAAAWLVHKRCLRDVGGFGYLFYHYGEDRDFLQRCFFFGHRLAVATSSAIRHDREGRPLSSRSYRRNVNYYYTGILARCTDINKSLARAAMNGLGWSLKETFYYFFSGNLLLPIIFLRTAASIIFSMGRIMAYRRITSSGSPFLFLDPGDNKE